MRFRVSRLGAALAVSILTGTATAPPRAQAQIPNGDRYAAIVTEARTGAVLFAANADERRYPASLTKIMTVYMALEALRDGRIDLNDPVRVSYSAASMPPSKLGLTPGVAITVEEAILALVTKSANDAAAALGEFLGGGSEERFAQMMTMRARSLGMTRTSFRNASGLPDLDQVTTARDMALLGRRVVQDFPRQYAYFSTPHFVFRGRTHWNHNRLLQEYDGTDGIKTGYVNDSGFNLVASSLREGVRLVAAVFGGRTGRERDRHMMAILDQGFGQMGVAPRAPAVHMAAARRPGLGTGLLASASAATTTASRRPALPSRAAIAAAAHRGRPALVSAARAASPRRAAVAAASRTAPGFAAPPAVVPGRQPALRLTSATVAPGRAAAGLAAARIEQGDTTGRGTAAVARTAQRAADAMKAAAVKVVAPRAAAAATTAQPRRRGT